MKVSKKSFIITEAVLGILVLILAVMMLRENNGEPLGRVSVIVRDSDNAQWAAFKYRIRMAAQDRGGGCDRRNRERDDHGGRAGADRARSAREPTR